MMEPSTKNPGTRAERLKELAASTAAYRELQLIVGGVTSAR